MAFDEDKVAASLEFDHERVADLRGRWLQLIDLVVWGEVKVNKVGALPRLRKRLLELGEDLSKLVGDRSWIPRPRERVKSAMAASVKVRETLLNLERAAKVVDGGADYGRFEAELLEFRRRLLLLLEAHEPVWGDMLEAQYDEVLDDEPQDPGGNGGD